MDTLERELAALLNRYSIENESNTPDFILAKYVRACLLAYAEAVQETSRWHLPPDVDSATKAGVE